MAGVMLAVLLIWGYAVLAVLMVRAAVVGPERRRPRYSACAQRGVDEQDQRAGPGQ